MFWCIQVYDLKIDLKYNLHIKFEPLILLNLQDYNDQSELIFFSSATVKLVFGQTLKLALVKHMCTTTRGISLINWKFSLEYVTKKIDQKSLK